MNEDIKNLKTPIDTLIALEIGVGLTPEQSKCIVRDVYQPLYLAIQGLNFELNVLRRSVKIDGVIHSSQRSNPIYGRD